MKKTFRWAAPAMLLLLPLLVAAAACGSGGGGSPTSPPPPQTGITFTPSGSGAGVSLATGAGSQGTTLDLQVQSSGIQDLYGVAFHLVYPFSVMHYTGATEGVVLNGGGTVPTTLQVVEAPSGTLIVGLTRLGTAAGTSSPGALMTLHFSAVASGSGSLSFTNDGAVASGGTPITGISWNGGTVQSTIVAGSASTALRH
jgi:hypothetical protein